MAVPSVVAPSLTVIVALGAAVPTSVGVVSSVLAPFARSPCLLPALSVALPTDTLTLLVSTVKFSGSLNTLVLPAASVAVVVMACAPLASGVVGVKLQLPLAWTWAVPSRVAPLPLLS